MDFKALSSGTCLWGYGEWDFTPSVAYGLAGHSTSGQVASAGVDPEARLFMKTLVFNPCSDDEIVVCYMDLLSGSIPLLGKIYQLMPELKDRLVLVGSHTHYGPGNYFGNRFYDGFAQTNENNPAGRNFAPKLVDHLANSIISSIKQARGECQQGRVAVLRSTHWGSAANRSYIAFQQNHEFADWNQSGMPAANPPSTLDSLQRAIDPRVTTILAINENADHVCAFSTLACHTTCLGPYNNFRYSADWAGIAANHFKQSAPDGHTYHSAFALNAAGDASSLDSVQLPSGGGPNAGQGDDLKRRRGSEIGTHVSSVVQSALPSVKEATGPIAVSLRSAWWSPTAGSSRPPRAGWPLIAGAEDGHGLRPPLEEGIRLVPRDWRHERRLRSRFPFQYPKRPFLNLLQILFKVIFEVPAYHPLCQLQIGSHLFLSAPCELTAVAGFRTEEIIKRADASITSVSVLTSTNSYMGYITTFQEYQSQQYEGGHNLFGFETLANLVSGHWSLRQMGVVVGKATAAQLQKQIEGEELQDLLDPTLLNEAPPVAVSHVIDDEGQLQSEMNEALKQLESGPVFEFEPIQEPLAAAKPPELKGREKGREKYELLDRLWGVQEVPVAVQVGAVDAQDYFEVSTLFLSQNKIKNGQVVSLRYGNQVYQSEPVSNFGDLGEVQKDVVVAIFLIPGRPIDGQTIELILP